MEFILYRLLSYKGEIKTFDNWTSFKSSYGDRVRHLRYYNFRKKRTVERFSNNNLVNNY